MVISGCAHEIPRPRPKRDGNEEEEEAFYKNVSTVRILVFAYVVARRRAEILLSSKLTGEDGFTPRFDEKKKLAVTRLVNRVSSSSRRGEGEEREREMMRIRCRVGRCIDLER